MPESIHIDPELAAKADALFRELGLDLSTAVQLFLRQALRDHGLPFTPRIPSPQPVTAPSALVEQAPAGRLEHSSMPQTADAAPEETRVRPAEEDDSGACDEDAEEQTENAPEIPTGKTEAREENPFSAAEGQNDNASFIPGGGDDLKQAFTKAGLMGTPLRRVRSLNRLYAIGAPNPHVKGWREVYVSGDEPFALDFGAVRVELGFHGGGSLRMMDGRLPDELLEADAVYPRDLSAVFSSIIGQPLTDVSSSRAWDDGQQRERLSMHFGNGCILTFAPGNDWGALWLSDAHGSVMFAPDAVWLRVLDDRALNGLR